MEKFKETDALFDFFVNKYQSTLNDIKTKRIDEVTESINNISEMLSQLQSELDNLHIKETEFTLAMDNLKKWQQDLDEANFNQEKLTKEFEEKRSDIYQQINDYDLDYQKKVKEYETIINFDNPIDKDYVIRATSNLTQYFLNDGYKKSLEFLNLLSSLRKLTNDYEEKAYMLGHDIIDLTNDIAHLEPFDPNLAINDVIMRMDSLTAEKNRIENVITSIKEMFDRLQEKHLSELKEVYNYNELIGLSKKENAEIIEKALDTYFEELKACQTDLEIEHQLYMRYNELANDINNLEAIVNENYQLSTFYNDTKAKLSLLNHKKTKLDNYVKNSYQVINSDQNYRQLYNSYVASLVEKSELEKNIIKFETDKQNYQTKRKTLINNPYAKDEVNSIDNAISELDKQIKNNQDGLSAIEKYQQKWQMDYQDVYDIMVNKTTIEDKMPLIEEKIEDLNILLASLEEKIENSSDKLQKYHELKAEIEDVSAKLQDYNH